MELSSPLNSNWLKFASYDTETRELKLGMGGKTYTHQGVPQEIYDGLVGADSAAKYWHSYIKGVYG